MIARREPDATVPIRCLLGGTEAELLLDPFDETCLRLTGLHGQHEVLAVQPSDAESSVKTAIRRLRQSQSDRDGHTVRCRGDTPEKPGRRGVYNRAVREPCPGFAALIRATRMRQREVDAKLVTGAITLKTYPIEFMDQDPPSFPQYPQKYPLRRDVTRSTWQAGGVATGERVKPPTASGWGASGASPAPPRGRPKARASMSSPLSDARHDRIG